MYRMYRAFILSFISTLALTVYSINIYATVDTYANNHVAKRSIITPSPKSEACTTIQAHWEGNIWYDTQVLCRYSNREEGVAWLQDYWVCIASTESGACTKWEYRPGHWIKVMQ
jgi:hypothetical protein